MIGEPPVDEGADQVKAIRDDEVTAALLASPKG